MKLKFILVIALGITSLSWSQNFSPTEFTALCNKELGEIEEYLTSNNWYFFEANDEKRNTLGNAKFVYDVPDFKKNKRPADYLFIYHYSEAASAQGIELLFKSKKTYQNFQEQLVNLKYKLYDSSISNGNIIKVYKKGSQIVEVTIPPNFEGMNGYVYLFAKKSSYFKMRNR